MSDPKFKPGDIDVRRAGGGDTPHHRVLSEGHGNNAGTHYLVRLDDGSIGRELEQYMAHGPRAVFTEAHKEAMWKLLGNRWSFNDWDELMERFSRDYGEQPEGEAQ